MRARLRTALAAVALAAPLVVAGCGASRGAGPAHRAPASYAGGLLEPARPAPPIRLADSDGHPFDLATARGKAVLVTFIYSHCPDTCPLIVSNLRTAQAELTPRQRSRLQILAVSTDPRGDTPRAVDAFLRRHGMSGRMRYLIGSRPQLERTWRRWGIVAKADPKTPNAVEHSALIYGVGADGRITTVYPANFKPADVAHDVPLLEARR